LITLDTLRRYAIGRSLFAQRGLSQAIAKLGFVQADPIRAPARAQDLILRQRVTDYRVGDLDRRYPRMALDEDHFVNYGIMPRATHRLMHPRVARTAWTAKQQHLAAAILDYVRAEKVAHPRAIAAHFQQGTVRNWFGGTSHATTQLLDGMHYRGMVRTARREGGIRVYAPGHDHVPPEDVGQAFVALLDKVVALYAPLPDKSLGQLASYLCGGVPQWRHLRQDALVAIKQRLAHASVDGERWFWPAAERPERLAVEPERVRLLAPFDPVVWDRHRFERLWGWAYRFEAYTPAAQRVRGYYAMPLLYGTHVIGWVNARVDETGSLQDAAGYVSGTAPKGRAYQQAYAAEREDLRRFLGLSALG
jgi:uncharacterized protein